MAEKKKSNKISRLRVLIIAIVSISIIAVILYPKIHQYINSSYSSVPEAQNVDSNSLKQTVFITTLDSNLPAHKNVIWCATFQMAWDKFKNDLIKEPIKLIGAQDIADRLNQSEYPPGNLNEDSYYTAAGFVKDGIIEKIVADMAKRFPNEPAPVFNQGYRTLPNPILAFAYLNVGIGFNHPYYTYQKAFSFVDSNKKMTNVTAFSSQSDKKDNEEQYVRQQVEILYYEYGENGGSDYFAVNLCTSSKPYQIILATVPQKNTLGETIADVENKISKFKSNNNHWFLSELLPDDKLIVPDVLYNLTHNYNELLLKYIGNEPWRSQSYFIFDAKQIVNFSLTRTGVVLSSNAFLGSSGGGVMEPPKPRNIFFNKPFLVYVKKRGADTKPFFAMWVDNAELLNKK
jgi:hypothetical protein